MSKIKKKQFDKKLLFYCCLIVLPLIQYMLFYVYVNFNSLLIAFSSYDKISNTSAFAGIDNFKEVIDTFFHSVESRNFGIRFRNSVTDYLIRTIVGTGGALFFSYYIYKKKLGGGLFKVILFLPQIIPGIVLISIYRFSVDTGIVSIYNKLVSEEARVISFLTEADTVYGLSLIHI